MATPPDFTAGAVLTAAQMNAVGLWLVKTQTIGTAVSSVTVNDAFSSDFANYLITLQGGSSSATTALEFRLGTSTTGYSYTLVYTAYNNTPAALGGGTGTTIFPYAGTISANHSHMKLEVLGPNLAKNTGVSGPFLSPTESGIFNGLHQVQTAYTSFRISPNSGTLTGGTIRVYGYRN